MEVDRIEAARKCARDLLRRFGVVAPQHIVLASFVRCLGITLRHAPLDGAAACLVRIGSRAAILINERVPDPAAQRFSIAHELGHFLLDHPGHTAADLSDPHRSKRAGSRDYEAEANAFASELLMPRELLGSTCETPTVDLDVPRQIAREYNVSILASARRFAELASERCAAVFSAESEVKWLSTSAGFTFSIKRGYRLEPASIAYRAFDKGSLVEGPQWVPGRAWFRTQADVRIVEHSIYSRELKTVLSMLWVPEGAASQLGMIP